jgi:hypothetical protein
VRRAARSLEARILAQTRRESGRRTKGERLREDGRIGLSAGPARAGFVRPRGTGQGVRRRRRLLEFRRPTCGRPRTGLRGKTAAAGRASRSAERADVAASSSVGRELALRRASSAEPLCSPRRVAQQRHPKSSRPPRAAQPSHSHCTRGPHAVCASVATAVPPPAWQEGRLSWTRATRKARILAFGSSLALCEQSAAPAGGGPSCRASRQPLRGAEACVDGGAQDGCGAAGRDQGWSPPTRTTTAALRAAARGRGRDADGAQAAAADQQQPARRDGSWAKLAMRALARQPRPTQAARRASKARSRASPARLPRPTRRASRATARGGSCWRRRNSCSR